MQPYSPDFSSRLPDSFIGCFQPYRYYSSNKLILHSFFPLFDSYIYNLITTLADIRLATLSVLSDFEQDNVTYVELRTTPRAIESANISKADYVSAVLDVVRKFNQDSTEMHCCLILSVDRRHTLQQAEEIVDLALANSRRGVVGIDLCGNPLRGDVSTLKPAFARAKASGLHITLHFGEVAASGTVQELRTMLDLQPERIGHIIHVPTEIKEEIKRKRLGLELCLSCNVLAQLTEGGFAGHHFSEWRNSQCPIALSVSWKHSIYYQITISLTLPRQTTWASSRALSRTNTGWQWNTFLSPEPISSPLAGAQSTASLVLPARKTV